MTIHPKLLEKGRRLVAGHRGMMAHYPENTLLSFEKAIALGVDMLELDINVSRDGELVVIHDLTADRTTDGSGPLRAMTLKEIKALDAGIKKGPAFKGLEVPTLREFCQLMQKHPDVLLNVEIKDRTEECVDKTVSLIDAHGLLPVCVFTCFDAGILKLLHQKHGLPTQGFPDQVLHNFEPGPQGTISHMSAVGIEMKLLTPELVQHYEQLGILPWAYCPDTEQSAAYALHCGARLVTCNDPTPAMRVFRA